MEEEKEKVDLEKKSGKKGKKSKKDKKEKEKKKEKNEKKEINKKEKKRKKEKENKEKGKRKPDFEGKLRSVENQEIMVSVTVLTYNHEKYIRQALDSILAQKTNFAFEILIGEDCSTDGTADIVREYERKYPNIIRAFCREKNLGANRNLYELAIQSKGKYVAGLEGDDYWSDSYKLQKQVDFLEVHNEYSACAHNFSYVDGNGNPIEERDIPAYDQDFWLNQKSVFTLDDFNEGKMVAQGSTLLYRNFFLKGIDTTVIYKAHPIVGDVTFMLLILSQGNIYKMPDRMLCYRRISSGSGSSWFGYCSTTRFHFYEIFTFFTKLELYARNSLRIRVDVRKRASFFFYHMVDNFFLLPTLGRLRCVCNMLRMTPHKMYYLSLFFKAIYLATCYPVMRNVFLPSKESVLYDKLHKTWKDLKSDLSNKKLVAWGAGDGGHALVNEYYGKLPIEYFVDSNIGRQGNYYWGYMIHPPEKMQEFGAENTVVLITTIHYENIIKQLEKMGFIHYYVYPIIERRKWRYWLLNRWEKDMPYIRD